MIITKLNNIESRNKISMEYILSKKTNKILKDNGIIFSKSKTNEIDDILDMYAKRMMWFREKNIKQWRSYLEHHPKEEFLDVISNGYYFTLKKDGIILAAFEISTDSKYWNDSMTPAYYIYKLTTKVGSKNIGDIVFNICADIAKVNNKKYLRIDCVASNEKLNEIYENHNFKLVKTGYEEYYHYALRQLIIN